jgi:hypothetical protein
MKSGHRRIIGHADAGSQHTSPFFETEETRVHKTHLLQSRQGRRGFTSSVFFHRGRGDAVDNTHLLWSRHMRGSYTASVSFHLDIGDAR